MDNSTVGRIVIICSTILIFWSLRRVFYALFLEYGGKAFYGALITPFVAYSKFFRSLKRERDKWAEETIRKHRDGK